MFTLAFILHPKVRIFTMLLCAILALVSMLSLGTGLTLVVGCLTLDTPPQWILNVISLWNVSSAVADITITISMMALLLHAKAGSSFGETRDLLSRLTRIVLQTGLLTSILALVSASLNFAKLNSYTLPWYMLGKSEVISLLANLNARNRSNALVLHGSDNGQAMPPATKMSSIVFSPPNRRTGEEVNNESIITSPPVRSLVQTNSQGRLSMNAEIPRNQI